MLLDSAKACLSWILISYIMIGPHGEQNIRFKPQKRRLRFFVCNFFVRPGEVGLKNVHFCRLYNDPKFPKKSLFSKPHRANNSLVLNKEKEHESQHRMANNTQQSQDVMAKDRLVSILGGTKRNPYSIHTCCGSCRYFKIISLPVFQHFVFQISPDHE